LQPLPYLTHTNQHLTHTLTCASLSALDAWWQPWRCTHSLSRPRHPLPEPQCSLECRTSQRQPVQAHNTYQIMHMLNHWGRNVSMLFMCRTSQRQPMHATNTYWPVLCTYGVIQKWHRK
jgi:hypothetical protein